MIILTKVFAILLGILVVTKTFHDYRKKLEGLPTSLFWTLAWIGIVWVALTPDTFYRFTQNLSKDNIGVGTFAGIAFVFLFFITYRVYVKANRLERKIRDIATKLALEEINDKI